MISLFSGSKHFVRNILLQSYLSVFVCEFRKKQKFGTFDLSFQQLIIIECVCVCMICAVEKQPISLELYVEKSKQKSREKH